MTYRSKPFFAGAGLLLCLGVAQAGPLTVAMTTNNGTVPGTAITYTVGVTGGTARNIFPSATSDNAVWTWPGTSPNFPEFLSSFGGPQTLTLTFSAPVPLSSFVFGVSSISNATDTVTLGGGTGTLSDIDLSDNLQVYNGPGLPKANFNSSTGKITAGDSTQSSFNISLSNESIMLGSTSSNTISTLTLAAGLSSNYYQGSWVGDGYTVFVGFVQPSDAPEPGSAGLLLAGAALMGAKVRRMRRA